MIKGDCKELNMTAVLNLFRLTDHLRNFVSVRGPPKNVNFLRAFLVIFPNVFLGSRTTKNNFANVPNFLAFFRVKDREKTFKLQSSCDTIHEKVPSLSSQFRQKPY